MPIYTYSNLASRVNAGIKGKIGMLINERDTMNQVVRGVVSDVDLRSTIRRTPIAPSLFNNVWEYACPTDMKGQAIIDIIPQANKPKADYNLTTSEEFYRRMDRDSIAFRDNDFIRKILVNSTVNSQTVEVSTLDSITAGGGTWVVSGDATNLRADTQDYVRGNASLKFDINAGAGTTAVISNSSLNTLDATKYLGSSGAFFVWAKINSPTGITGYTIFFGSSVSDLYSKTVTTASDGTAFKAGWNLLRFTLDNLTTFSGSPNIAAVTVVVLQMNKATSKISETDYGFDQLNIKVGEINDVQYYSKYGWQTSGGTYIENSTVISDVLNADTDEFELFVQKGIEMAGNEVDEISASDRAEKAYKTKKAQYLLNNPSLAKSIILVTQDFITTW